MSKSLSRVLSAILAISMLMVIALTAVGCGKKETVVNGRKQVQITFWEMDAPDVSDPTLKKIVSDFEAKNPDIKVTMTHYEGESLRTTYQNQVAAGSGPSLILCPDDNVGLFGTAKTAMELDNFVPKEVLENIDPKVLDGAKINGKLYGVPLRVGNCLVMLYNKKLVDKMPETMDAFIAKAKELTKAPDQYGFAYPLNDAFWALAFLGGFNGKVMDDKGNITLDTEAMKKTSQLLYDFKYKHQIVPKEADYNVASNLFKEGKLGFIINGPWAFDEYTKAGIDLGIGNIPKTADGVYPAPYTGAKVLVVNPNLKEEQKDAVKKFIAFINNKENQIEIAKVNKEFPTNIEAAKDAYFTENEQLKALAEQMAVGTPMPILPQMRAVWDGVKPVLADMMANKVKPADAPKKMQEAAKEKARTMLGE